MIVFDKDWNGLWGMSYHCYCYDGRSAKELQAKLYYLGVGVRGVYPSFETLARLLRGATGEGLQGRKSNINKQTPLLLLLLMMMIHVYSKTPRAVLPRFIPNVLHRLALVIIISVSEMLSVRHVCSLSPIVLSAIPD